MWSENWMPGEIVDFASKSLMILLSTCHWKSELVQWHRGYKARKVWSGFLSTSWQKANIFWRQDAHSQVAQLLGMSSADRRAYFPCVALSLSKFWTTTSGSKGCTSRKTQCRCAKKKKIRLGPHIYRLLCTLLPHVTRYITLSCLRRPAQ